MLLLIRDLRTPTLIYSDLLRHTHARLLSVDSRLTEFRLTAILLERDVSFGVFPDAEPGHATPAPTVKGRSWVAKHDTRASQFSTACLVIVSFRHGR
jgi:hypothetical protein